MSGIVLTLGAGGARGLCHIGALRVLEEAGIGLAGIRGASMGAIIGAAYCSGTPLSEIEEHLCSIGPLGLTRFSLTGPSLFSNRGVKDLVRSLLRTTEFESLRIPLVVACTDLETGRPVFFSQRDLIDPVVGSSLAAGVFHPVKLGSCWLVDGGYTEPLPVDLRDRSPQVVVDPTVRPTWSLDLGRLETSIVPRLRIWSQWIKSVDIMVAQIVANKMARFEGVHVVPSMDGVAFTEFGRAKEVIAAGAEATRAALPRIREMIIASAGSS